MSGMFHEDGCVRANIRTHLFEVYVVANCPHTKVAAAVYWVSAEDERGARTYVEQNLLPSMSHVSEVRLMCHDDGKSRCSRGQREANQFWPRVVDGVEAYVCENCATGHPAESVVWHDAGFGGQDITYEPPEGEQDMGWPPQGS